MYGRQVLLAGELWHSLRNHAESVLAGIYRNAVEPAAAETELPEATFPAACPYSLDQLLSADLLAE
jgi:hypothetical protein